MKQPLMATALILLVAIPLAVMVQQIDHKYALSLLIAIYGGACTWLGRVTV